VLSFTIRIVVTIVYFGSLVAGAIVAGQGALSLVR